MLNATFGNAAELIITLFAINAGQLEVAQASIIGSIIGNTLLVLGVCFVLGGLRHGVQTFNERLAGRTRSMLVLAVSGSPSRPCSPPPAIRHHAAAISDVTAAVLLGCTACRLLYYFRGPSGATPSAARTSRTGPRAWPGAPPGLDRRGGRVSDVFVGTIAGSSPTSASRRPSSGS